jgi:MFS family permease
MKWPNPDISAHRMAALSVAGSLLAAVSFLLPAPSHGHGAPWRIAIFVAIILIGGAVWIVAVSRLKDGVQNSRWPEAQIESLRTVTESPVLTGLFFVLFLFFFVTAFPFSSHPAHPALRGYGWAAFLLGQCCAQLRSSTQRPRTPPTTRLDWRSRPPIRSNHWGER